MPAPAPARSSGSGTINFGLVSIGVKLYNGIDPEAGEVKREMRSPAGNRVNFLKVDATTKEPLRMDEITMVYVTDDAKDVVLTDEEKDAAAGLSDNWTLVGFYPLAEMGNFVFESLVQVRPATVGKKRPYDEAFATLMLAMADRGVFALIQYVNRGPKVGVLTSDGNMRLAYHSDCIREAVEMPHSSLVDSSARSFASQLIGSMTLTGAQAPENTSVQRIKEYVAIKAEGVVANEVMESNASAGAAATDLMAALKASIASINAEKAKAS